VAVGFVVFVADVGSGRLFTTTSFIKLLIPHPCTKDHARTIRVEPKVAGISKVKYVACAASKAVMMATTMDTPYRDRKLTSLIFLKYGSRVRRIAPRVTPIKATVAKSIVFRSPLWCS